MQWKIMASIIKIVGKEYYINSKDKTVIVTKQKEK